MEEKKICYICGKEINEEPTRNRFLPAALFKWTLGHRDNSKAYNFIISDDNVFFAHEKCNYLKQDQILDVDSLFIPDEKKKFLKFEMQEFNDIITQYKFNKEYVKKTQNNKCSLCGKPLEGHFILRRINNEKKREIYNAKAICIQCNAKSDNKEGYYN